MAENQSPPHRATAKRTLERLDYIMFVVAVWFLLLILIVGLWDDVQYNIIYLVCLSLACAMVFAYLPFVAELNAGWFKAGGAAAIFAVCMWQTLPFAREFTQQKFHKKMESANNLVEFLQAQAKKRDEELGRLRGSLSSLSAANADSSSFAKVLTQSIEGSLGAAMISQSALQSAKEFATAAKDNKSDAETCAARASSSLDYIVEVQSNVDKLESLLASAKATIGK
jgi:hypothetical protein